MSRPPALTPAVLVGYTPIRQREETVLVSQEGACNHCETLASLGREVSETAIPPRRSPATPALPRASGQAEDRNTSASLLLWPQRRGLPSCPMAVRDGST